MSDPNPFNHKALANPDLSYDHEQKKPIDEVDKNGSDKQKDKNAQNPSHKTQEKHGIRNDHELEKSNELNQNYHCVNIEDNNDDEDKDETDDEKDENEYEYEDEDEDEDESDEEDDDDDSGGDEDESEDDDDDDESDDEDEGEDEDEIMNEDESGEDEDDDQVENEDHGADEEDNQSEVEDEGKGDDEDESTDNNEDEDGYITVNLLAVRKEFQCPICLGIIRKTRTVMQCLHRFCKACIDKSIRTGNNECPVCRAHCASRRSLKDDPNYDTLISLLYPDIDKEEEEEMTLQENEMNHNNQIQASIAKTRQHQVEAMVRKRRGGNSKNNVELQVSNDNDNYARMDSPSGVEKTETEQKEGEEQEAQFLLEYSSNNAYMNRETLAWGMNARSNRISRIINHLRDSNANNDELEIHFMLVSLDEQKIPSLQEPYIRCKPTVSVRILSKYVALKAGLQANQVELYLVEKPQANIIRGEKTVSLELEEDKLRVLRDEETLAELYTHNVITCGHMLLAYKMK